MEATASNKRPETYPRFSPRWREFQKRCSVLCRYGAVITKGSAEPKYKELAYLKTALINGCAYCFRAHSASGKKNGVSEEQIKNLAFYRRSSAFDAKEKATILYAERVTRGASAIREGAINELKQLYSDDQIVELTLTICIANFTNRFNDAMMIAPDIG
jgi:AhpD family alkylhydroperoxidase